MLSIFKKLFPAAVAIDFRPLLQQGAVVIDVRTPEEYHMAHVKGSINIPLQVLHKRVADLKKKHRVVIAICRSGRRSRIAVNILHHAGINAYNGGGWKKFRKAIES